MAHYLVVEGKARPRLSLIFGLRHGYFPFNLSLRHVGLELALRPDKVRAAWPPSETKEARIASGSAGRPPSAVASPRFQEAGSCTSLVVPGAPRIVGRR